MRLQTPSPFTNLRFFYGIIIRLFFPKTEAYSLKRNVDRFTKKRCLNQCVLIKYKTLMKILNILFQEKRLERTYVISRPGKSTWISKQTIVRLE